jgi:cytochrome b
LGAGHDRLGLLLVVVVLLRLLILVGNGLANSGAIDWGGDVVAGVIVDRGRSW